MVARTNKKHGIGWYVIAALICVIHFIPFYILIGMAFKSPGDLSSRWVMPGYLYLDNIKIALEKGKILLGLANSTVITICAVTLVTLIGAMAAYPLARYKTGLNKKMLKIILGVMMVPPLSILVPLYSMIVSWGGTSKLSSLIIVVATFQLPVSIFLYANFVDTIPRDIDEAALIDGCNRFEIFYRIILPLLKPVTVSVVILSAGSFWNDYQFSLYILQSPKVRTLTLAVSSFFSQTQSNLNAAAAGALLAALPMVIIFLALQKYFIQGMVDSAVK
ncbi:MAG: carbohydrate ABC transporter permease [Cellulosilyticaceae bacterium]